MKIRIGQGVDAHQLMIDAPLIIGGVSIPFQKGSKGYSDGDVLYHAIVDAILGALALGDIDQHFPSNDKSYKNIDSSQFLTYTHSLIREKNYEVSNIDATIILQEPQLSIYIAEMKKNISQTLAIPAEAISIKATTTDHLGFIGSGEGIAATAVALLTKINGN